MAEDTAEKMDLLLESLKPYMNEGEVFITNSVDQNSESWKKRIHRKDEKSGQQLAQELMSYGETGKWQAVRVVEHAFDIEGKSMKGMVSLVGTPKKQG